MDRLSQLRWGPPGALQNVGDVASPPGTISEDPLCQLIKITGMPNVPSAFASTTADKVEFLLQAAAEVEHGLLVQYLYAAYSVSAADSKGWQGRLINIAVQEMAHLLNVQNMLLAIGRNPYFGRSQFPTPPNEEKFYPFPFKLEPLIKESLGKYVAAESPAEVLGMPDFSHLTNEEKKWLPEAIDAGKHGAMHTINHVGVIYAKLYWMFQENDTPIDPWKLPAKFFEGIAHISEKEFADAAKLDARQGQGGPNDGQFRGVAGPEPDPPPESEHPHRVIWSMKTRADVRAAIAQIAEQGEGTQRTDDSHFVEFLDIFGEFVTLQDAGGPLPVFPIPTNPNTRNDNSIPEGRITHLDSLAWAKLFNLRYNILLTDLALSLSESPGENIGGNGLAKREELVNRAITRDMKNPFGISGLALRLITKLPLKADGTGQAAPPFELPDRSGKIDLPLPTDARTPIDSALPIDAEGHRDFLLKLLDESATTLDDLITRAGGPMTPDGKKLTQLKNADAAFKSDVALMTFTP